MACKTYEEYEKIRESITLENDEWDEELIDYLDSLFPRAFAPDEYGVHYEVPGYSKRYKLDK